MGEPTRYLGTSGLAERTGLALGTVQRYSHEGRLPAPDVVIGQGPRAVRGWLPQTVDAWAASRPGRPSPPGPGGEGAGVRCRRRSPVAGWALVVGGCPGAAGR